MLGILILDSIFEIIANSLKKLNKCAYNGFLNGGV